MTHDGPQWRAPSTAASTDPFAAPPQRPAPPADQAPSWPPGPAATRWSEPPPAWDTAAAGQGWGPPSPSTNPWAVVALVSGLVALVPVAVAAGVVGLVQTARHRQAGRGLAIGGLVAAGVWTVLLAVLGAAFFVTGPSYDPRLGRVAEAGSTTTGTCLRLGGQDAAPEVVPCADEHDAEVYRVQDLPRAVWPGEDDVDAQADDTCYDAFEDYVGRSYRTSRYDYGYFLPDRVEWARGERRVVCAVLPFDDDVLLGSVRGTGE